MRLINVTDLDGHEHWVNPEAISHINADIDPKTGPCYGLWMLRMDSGIWLDPSQCAALLEDIKHGG
jgi:hypothetical protein